LLSVKLPKMGRSKKLDQHFQNSILNKGGGGGNVSEKNWQLFKLAVSIK
jgi:hypothetical protein